MTMVEFILVVFSSVWIAGWLATLFETGTLPDTNLFWRIAGAVMLFFLWPFIACAMARSRH